MKKFILCLIPLAASLHAGELAPSQIPSAAKWMLHADFDAMRGCETGKAVFQQVEADHGAQLQAFKRMFSVHLIDDVHDVTLFGDGKPEHAVLLIKGKFDRAHIEDVLKGADNYSEATYEGMNILTWEDKGLSQHAAFAGPDLLVFSRQNDLLRQEILTLKANVQVPADPFFTADGATPLLCASANLAGVDMPTDSARILRMANHVKIAANENSGHFSIRMAADSSDAARAEQLRRMLDGVIAFADAGNPDPDHLHFTSAIACTKDKPGVSATISLPLAEWLALMKKEAAKKK